MFRNYLFDKKEIAREIEISREICNMHPGNVVGTRIILLNKKTGKWSNPFIITNYNQKDQVHSLESEDDPEERIENVKLETLDLVGYNTSIRTQITPEYFTSGRAQAQLLLELLLEQKRNNKNIVKLLNESE